MHSEEFVLKEPTTLCFYSEANYWDAQAKSSSLLLLFPLMQL